MYLFLSGNLVQSLYFTKYIVPALSMLKPTFFIDLTKNINSKLIFSTIFPICHAIKGIFPNSVDTDLDLRKPDLRNNLDLRKIVATNNFLLNKLFDLGIFSKA